MEDKKDFSWSFFPWDNGAKPDFVNDEGFEWYIDKDMTDWARRDEVKNGAKGMKDVACFFVKKGDHITRLLINDKQQILHEDSSLEGMATHIDMLKAARMFD